MKLRHGEAIKNNRINPNLRKLAKFQRKKSKIHWLQ